jgi:precorrin-2 dehydrogenase / sirohydrochlorin ferrochelatase
MKRLYPLFADLEARRVVVIGGGAVAQRKAETLLACGADVRLISPEATEQLAGWAAQGRIAWQRRRYESGDLAGAWLAIVACGDPTVNEQVRAEADAVRLFCNVVDEPEHCSFQAAAVVTRGPLQVAVSTGGVSPALAKRLRRELEAEFGPFYEKFLAGLAELRDHVKQKYPDDQARRANILEDFVNSDGLELLRSGHRAEFMRLLEEWKER